MQFIGELAALATSFFFAMTALIFIQRDAWSVHKSRTACAFYLH